MERTAHRARHRCTPLACRARRPATARGHCSRRGGVEKTAKIKGPATAEWCDSLRFSQIQALCGDTGVAIALYPVAASRPGDFPGRAAGDRGQHAAVGRVALRWFAETSIRGFQGDSGVVVVEQPRPGSSAGHLRREGAFGDRCACASLFGVVSLTRSCARASRGCPSRPNAPDSGAGVH